MAEIFKFFNSAPGDERWHYASDFADYFGDVLSSGLLHKDGTPNLLVKVNPGTMQTVVEPGKALMQGYQYKNTTPLLLTHGLPEPDVDRIDRIVLRLDKRNNARFIKLFVKEGVSAENPVAPTLQRDNYVHEISLAQIRVVANTASLEQLNLVDERMYEELCGIVYSLISVPTSVFQQQWDVWFNSIKGGVEAEVIAWQLQEMANFDAWQAQEKADFDAWFASIQNILDGDIAAQLAAKITTLEQDFEAHENNAATTSTPGHVKIVDSVSSESTTEAVTPRAVKQVNDTLTTHADDFTSHVHFAVATNENDKVITLDHILSSLPLGFAVSFANSLANTGPVTLNVNNLGAVPVLNAKGESLKAGALATNSIYTVRYNSATGNFILQGDGGGDGFDYNKIFKGLTEVVDITESYTRNYYLYTVAIGTKLAVTTIGNAQVGQATLYNLDDFTVTMSGINLPNVYDMYVSDDDQDVYTSASGALARYINGGKTQLYLKTVENVVNKNFSRSGKVSIDNEGHIFMHSAHVVYKVNLADGVMIKKYTSPTSQQISDMLVDPINKCIYIINTVYAVRKLNFDLELVWEKTATTWKKVDANDPNFMLWALDSNGNPVLEYSITGYYYLRFTKFNSIDGSVINERTISDNKAQVYPQFSNTAFNRYANNLVYFDAKKSHAFNENTFDFLGSSAKTWAVAPGITMVRPSRDGKTLGATYQGSNGMIFLEKPMYKIIEGGQ